MKDKEIINTVFNEATQQADFTVGDLINYLNAIDKNLLVGVKGHFGEFYPIDMHDFLVTEGHEYLSWEQKRKNIKPKQKRFLNISTPDIGPEPD